MNLPLETVARSAVTAYHRGEDLLLTAAQHILECQRRVHCGEYVGTWKQFCSEHLDSIKERRIRALLAIARAPDPRAALLEQREETAERVRDFRERQQSAVETALRNAGITQGPQYKDESRPEACCELEQSTDAPIDARDAIDDALGVQEDIRNHVRGTFGTGENEWYTPAEYVEAARACLGGIDLDPATSETAQSTVRAARFFTRDDDGLRHPWPGRIWLNPPYAQPAIARFIEKLLDELATGRAEQAILLTHNYTDTAWFHAAAERSAAICFTRGRIRFVSANGELAAPTQGQAFFYFGSAEWRFLETFGSFGFIR
jgi:phage N-6-adenine-methyltransferase